MYKSTEMLSLPKNRGDISFINDLTILFSSQMFEHNNKFSSILNGFYFISETVERKTKTKSRLTSKPLFFPGVDMI